MMVEDDILTDLHPWDEDFHPRVVRRAEELVLGTRPRPTLDNVLTIDGPHMMLAKNHEVVVDQLCCTEHGVVGCFVDERGFARQPTNDEFRMWTDLSVRRP
jgi:hypothetical protein